METVSLRKNELMGFIVGSLVLQWFFACEKTKPDREFIKWKNRVGVTIGFINLCRCWESSWHISLPIHADDKPAPVMLPYRTPTLPYPYPTMARIFIQRFTLIET